MLLQVHWLIGVESLRLYPQPPLLIRHTLKPETLHGMYEVAFIKIQEASVMNLLLYAVCVQKWLEKDLDHVLCMQEDTKVKRKVIKFQKGPISSFP